MSSKGGSQIVTHLIGILETIKPYFKPDYQINLKWERVECTGNPSI